MNARYLIGTALVAGFAVLTVSPATAKNTIRWASQGDALTSDPHAANESPTHSASRKIYDVLYYNDKDMKNRPWLATGFELIDPLTWQFSLRKGVKFHDGSDFTAEDVKFSIERALSPTRPRVFPASMLKSTPSTAWIHPTTFWKNPRRTGKYFFRPSTWRTMSFGSLIRFCYLSPACCN